MLFPYRLLRAVETLELKEEVRTLLQQEISKSVTTEALSIFQKLFGNIAGIGTQLVVEHVAGLEDPDSIAESSVILSQELLELTFRLTMA